MFYHIRFKRSALFGNQKRYWTKIKKLWKASPNAVVDTAKYFFPCQILTAWVTIEKAFLFVHDLDIFITKAQCEPIKVTLSRSFLKVTFLYYVLYSFQLRSAVLSVYAKNVLLFSFR